MSRNHCLLKCGRSACDLCSRCCMWFPCIWTQLSALCCTEVCALLKIPGFTRISWQAFCTHCCNTSKSLINAEYTKVFRCLNSQKSRGLRLRDGAGQLTGPPCPIHCPPKVWFRCCLTMWRKWGGVPSCVNHMCWWWRGTCSKSTGKLCTC
jgi:hypothetical protein